MTLKQNDLHYLKTIHRRLKEFRSVLRDDERFSLGGEAFADELDWLDCFIDKHSRKAT
jgi:hypothetical protein